MKGKARRLLSWVCVLALCMSLLPVTALAKTPETKAGQGTYVAVEFANIADENSTNDHTVAYAIWTATDGTYYIAFAHHQSKDITATLGDDNLASQELSGNLTVIDSEGNEKIDNMEANAAAGKGSDHLWTIVTLDAEKAKECFRQEGDQYILDIQVSTEAGGHDLENIKITKDFVDDTPLGDPEMNPIAHPITIEVMVDGAEMDAGANVTTYVTVSPDQASKPASWDEASQGAWDPGTFHEESDTVTYSVTYYDCKDIGFKATDGYVIEAVDADLVYGQRGCQGITNNNGTVTADNVKGGSTVTVYVRSAYTVEYYQVEGGQVTLYTKDDAQYVAKWTTQENVNGNAQNPTDSDKYYKVCNCEGECEHKGFTDINGAQPGKNYVFVETSPATSITLPNLPTVSGEKEVTGWYLNEDCNGEQKGPNSSVPVSNVKETATDRVIKFYAKVTDKAQPSISVEKKLIAVERDGQNITDSLDNTTLYAGDKLTWTITVTNNGNADATELKLEDVLKAGDDIRTLDTILKDGQNFNLSEEFTVKEGNTVTFTATYTVTATDEGKILTNTATVSGGNVDPENPSGETQNPVGYTYTVTYNGNGGTVESQATKQETVRTASEEESVQYTVKNDAFGFDRPGYTFDGWYGNAEGTGEAQTGQEVTITENTTYYAKWKEKAPTVDAEKTTDKGTQSVKLGDKIQYTITIQAGEGNQGILKNFSVKDNKFPSKVEDITIKLDNETPSFETAAALKDGILTFKLEDALEKGQTLTITYSYTVTQDDVANGEVTNSATVKAWNEDENQSGTDEDNTVITPVEPVITLEKKLVEVDGEPYKEGNSVTSGNQLKYQITVENTGGADATNNGHPFVLADTMWKDGAPDNYQVIITDANGNSQDQTRNYPIEGDSVKIEAIPARSQYVFTYTYTVQQSDEGKTLENTATLAYNAEETIKDTVKVDVEKTHCTITYKYESGTADKDLPDNFPAAPAPQTMKIGEEVQLPEPESTKVYVEDGVWIWTSQGWRDEAYNSLTLPVCATGDMTIIGLWVFNETYTLTYDANGGDNGSVPTDSTAYTEGQTATLDTENKPTHAQAPTPEGSVITDEELVDVVFIGWSTTQTDKIFAAGEDYGDIVTQVTFQDQDITVYAVWGYDENGDGIADAQQIVITPADITIYTGGQSYDGIVEGENGEIAENNGMPEPGFYFILPYELDNELGGRGNTADLTGKLRLHYENGDDIRTWDLALYNEEAGTANKVYGKYYIYRLVPVDRDDLVVRVEIQDGDRLVTSDRFDISLDGELYKEYTMTLYTNSVEQNRVTAQTNVDGTGWTSRDTQGIALGTGTLTIRGTNVANPVSPIQENVTDSVDKITAKAAEGTEYTINDSDLPVVNQDAVQLLNDSLVEGSTDALKSAIVDEAANDGSVTITEEYQFDFRYLDLVDTSNGNAYATTDKPLEIYWPYPDGTNQDTTFYIAHFDGLDREFDPDNLENELNGAELKIYSANTENSGLELENTEQGIKISTSTFSPFVLVYNQKDAAAPSLTVDKELTAVNGKAPGSSVSVGDTLTYTITVTNNGNVDLTGVSVKDTFNGKGTLNFVASSDYTVTNNNDGTYTITLNSNLAVDNSVKITATYKVLRGDANGTLTNAVSVTGKTTDGTEIPTPGGDTEETPVNPYHPPIRPPVDPDKPELNTEDHYAYIVGYPDGNVKPEGNITRAEVATIFFRLLTDESRDEFWSQTNPYSDVSEDDWYNNAVSTLTNAGIIDGYEDGTFKPNGNITRAEFATIAVRFFEATYEGENLFPDIDGHWAQDYINEAANAGIVDGYPDGTFGPQKLITRAEAMTMVNRTIDRHPDADHLLEDMITWPDNPETAWYYEQVQEATNSHEYTMNTDDEQNPYEIWTKLLPNRDWSELEKEWSDANDGAGSGEVV